MSLREFIEKYQAEINNKKFGEVYSSAGDELFYEDIGKLTELFYKCRIDPLKYMIEVPKCYAYESRIKIINIPNNIRGIGIAAFSGCNSLTSIIIPDSVTSIGSRAFYDCSKLTSVTVPDSILHIGSDVFDACPIEKAVIDLFFLEDLPKQSLEEITINGEGSIPSEYFSYLQNLIHVIIGDKVDTIENDVFFNCPNLRSVTIGKEIKKIGHEAFRCCPSLNKIIIPRGVKYIGDEVFSDCPKLKTIYCEVETQPEGWEKDWLGDCTADVVWG